MIWIEFKQCHVEDFFVDLDYRSKGIGTSLMENVISYAKEMDCEVIELNSLITNIRAHKFYERVGFIKQSYRFKQNLKDY